MEAEKDYPEGGFDAYEIYQTLNGLREFAYGAGENAGEKVWITRKEARVISDLIWLFMDKVETLMEMEKSNDA